MKTPTNKFVTWLVRIAYLGVIALATLSALRFQWDLDAARWRLTRAFRPAYAAKDVVDAVQNLALFAGWGALWTATGKPNAASRTILAATVTGACFSLVVEALQLFSPFRSASILDVATNSLGACAGAAFILVMVRVAAEHRGHDGFLGIPAFTFAGAYFLATALFALAVTRPHPFPEAWGGPRRRFGISLEHFDWSSGFGLSGGAEALLFVPLGFFFVTALRESEWRVSWATLFVSTFGIIASAAVETARGFLGLEISAGAAAAHALGVLIGALGAALFASRFGSRLRSPRAGTLAGAAYTAVVLSWSWKPFLPETNWQLIREQLSFDHLVPLIAYSWRTDLFGVADVGAGFFLYLPLGALLAASPLRRTGLWSRFWPGLYVAVLSEFGQIAVRGRTADATDLLVQCAGVLMGWVMMRQAGFGTTPPGPEATNRVLVTPAPDAP